MREPTMITNIQKEETNLIITSAIIKSIKNSRFTAEIDILKSDYKLDLDTFKKSQLSFSLTNNYPFYKGIVNWVILKNGNFLVELLFDSQHLSDLDFKKLSKFSIKLDENMAGEIELESSKYQSEVPIVYLKVDTNMSEGRKSILTPQEKFNISEISVENITKLFTTKL